MHFMCKCSHINVRSRARTHTHTRTNTGELKDLRQQLYDIQQVREREANEREREQNEHRVALSSLKTALDETKAAHKGTQDKLAAAEQKLAATELQLVQAQTHTETDKTTDASHTPPAGVAPAPATKPNSAGSRPASKAFVCTLLYVQTCSRKTVVLNAQTFNTFPRWSAKRERSEENRRYKGDTWCGDEERKCRGFFQKRGTQGGCSGDSGGFRFCLPVVLALCRAAHHTSIVMLQQ